MFEPPELGDTEAKVLLAPLIEGLLADPCAPTDLDNRLAAVRLVQCVGDLLRLTPTLLHVRSSFPEDRIVTDLSRSE